MGDALSVPFIVSWLARIGHVYLHSHTATEKTEIGVNKDALMWTGSCLVPVRRLRPQCISVPYSKQIRKEHLCQNAHAARNNED